MEYDSHHSYTQSEMESLLSNLGSERVQRVREEKWTWEGSCPRSDCGSTHDAFHARLQHDRKSGQNHILVWCRRCQEEGRMSHAQWLDQFLGQGYSVKHKPRYNKISPLSNREIGQYISKNGDPRKNFSNIEPQHIIKMQRNKDQTIRYMQSRGINERLIKFSLMGYTGESRDAGYTSNRFAIPNWSPWGTPYGIHLRRNDEYVREFLEMVGQDVIDRNMEAIKRKWEKKNIDRKPTMDDYIRIYFPKYTFYKPEEKIHNHTAPFNYSVMMDPPEILHVFEDAMSMFVMVQEGYAAMGWKPSLSWEKILPHAVKKVDQIVYWADNDKYHNAGLEYAKNLMHITGRGVVMKTPDPYKDANEFYIHDKEGFLDWVNTQGFFPIYPKIEERFPGYMRKLYPRIKKFIHSK